MPILPKRCVRDLQSYQRPLEGRHDYVRLDFNENTQGFPAAYPPGIPHQMISAYPEYASLTKKVADFYKVPEEYVMLTNGSDEGLMVAATTFVEPGESYAIVSNPCFSMIPHGLLVSGAKLREVHVLPDLSFDLAGIERALESGATIAMFATPENPTGAVLPPDTVRQWCAKYKDTLFVIDEAYGEFTDVSMLAAVNDFENLLVLKTFSKAWGMAGLRLGVVFGSPQVLDYMQRVKLPYSVNSAAVWTANQLLDHFDEVQASIQDTVKNKNQLADALKARGYRIESGQANSVLLGAGINAGKLTDFCRQQGVLVRNRSSMDFPSDMNGSRSVMWGKVRVSVGTVDEHEKFLDTLESFNKQYGVLFDLDGTLVDTSTSFDKTVQELVHKHSKKPLPQEQLDALRSEGGYNDDWVAAHELLRRRGVDVPLAELTKEAVDLYLDIAKTNEKLILEVELLRRIKKRHPVMIVTGRTRPEYEPVWADRLTAEFDKVYCLGDCDGKPKPAPDYLLKALRDHGLTQGVYVGNSVDDMQAARAAGLDAIGVATNQSAEVLKKAGAQLVLPTVDLLAEVFML